MLKKRGMIKGLGRKKKQQWIKAFSYPLPSCLPYRFLRNLFLPMLANPIRAEANSSMLGGSGTAVETDDSSRKSLLLISADADADVLEKCHTCGWVSVGVSSLHTFLAIGLFLSGILPITDKLCACALGEWVKGA